MPHTPGPWRLRDEQFGQQYPVRLLEVRAGDGVIVNWRGFDGVAIAANQAEIEANARLIVAAPKLLEACKAVLSALAPMGYYGPEHDLLVAAIAEAEA